MLGGLIFNAGFALAAVVLQDHLRDSWVVERIFSSNMPFWSQASELSGTGPDVLDVIFVDDVVVTRVFVVHLVVVVEGGLVDMCCCCCCCCENGYIYSFYCIFVC